MKKNVFPATYFRFPDFGFHVLPAPAACFSLTPFPTNYYSIKITALKNRKPD